MIILSVTIAAQAQPQPSGTVKLQNVLQVTADRAGDFYAITDEAIHKYDSSGTALQVAQTPSPTTLFDTGNGVRPPASASTACPRSAIASRTMVSRRAANAAASASASA